MLDFSDAHDRLRSDPALREPAVGRCAFDGAHGLCRSGDSAAGCRRRARYHGRRAAALQPGDTPVPLRVRWRHRLPNAMLRAEHRVSAMRSAHNRRLLRIGDSRARSMSDGRRVGLRSALQQRMCAHAMCRAVRRCSTLSRKARVPDGARSVLGSHPHVSVSDIGRGVGGARGLRRDWREVCRPWPGLPQGTEGTQAALPPGGPRASRLTSHAHLIPRQDRPAVDVARRRDLPPARESPARDSIEGP